MKRGIIIPHTNYTATLGDFGFRFSGNTLGTERALNMHREKRVKPTSIKEEDFPS